MDKTPYNQPTSIDCNFKRILYPKNYNGNSNSSTWMLVLYVDKDGNQFTANGNNLPVEKSSLSVRLHGCWKPPTDKYDSSFKVDYHEVVLPKNQKGFVEYISSLKVGIGKIRATDIYKKFGEASWQVIENNPMKLTEIPGITEAKVKRLTDKIESSVIERQLTKLFAGAIDVSAQRITSIKNKLGTKNLVDKIALDPYILCELNGFSFQVVDRLGQKLQVPPSDKRRIEAATKTVLQQQCNFGHVCTSNNDLMQSLIPLLNKAYPNNPVDDITVMKAINSLCKEQRVYFSANRFYLRKQYDEEVGIVYDIRRLQRGTAKAFKKEDIEAVVAEYEKEHHFTLASCQRAAVITTLANSVSIITGGPGTGKSTITRAVLWTYEKLAGKIDESDIVLMAPTGRAARRMEEATNHPATTIHHMIGFRGEGEESSQNGQLEGEMFIIDESSMIDQHIGFSLLSKIPSGARVVFVGDPEQLPSVGCGNFLADLINSERIATTKLDQIFRQADGSPIIENAYRIKHGRTDLDYSHEKFRLYEEQTSEEVFKRACILYLQSVQQLGVENVILLNAYRNKTERNPLLCVDTFNKVLQDKCNPAKPDALTMSNNKHTFRVGDLVMQMKNTEIAKNGDVGRIHDIVLVNEPDDPDTQEKVALIEFNGDGEINRYTEDMIDELDLAYCTTIHKSQGSQYKRVIMVVSRNHSMLNNRATIYTGITRAEDSICLVTETSYRGRSAIERAILDLSAANRNTLLAQRLRYQKI